MVTNYNEIIIENETLDSNRITLRKFNKEDAADIFEIGSDAETVKYLTWGPYTKPEEAHNTIFNFYLSRHGIYAIELKAEKKCIGCIDIRITPEHEKATFGYMLNRHYWGNGYMTEALNAIFSLCFNKLKLNRVEAMHYTPNQGSGRVMQKCGMQFEGTFKQEVKVKGVFYNCTHYGITADDWKKLHA